MGTARGTVHAWQCDAMGQVSVRACGERFEEACWQYCAMPGIVPSRLRAGEIPMAAVRHDTRYLSEFVAGQVVDVRTTMLEVRDKVLRFVHAMVNAGAGAISATSGSTVVCLDPRARRSRPFPADVLAHARALLPAG